MLKAAAKRWDGDLSPEIREAMKAAAILHLEGAPDGFASVAWRWRYASVTAVDVDSDTTRERGILFDDAVELTEVLRDPELTAIARDARHPSTGEPGIPDRARKLKAMRGN